MEKVIEKVTKETKNRVPDAGSWPQIPQSPPDGERSSKPMDSHVFRLVSAVLAAAAVLALATAGQAGTVYKANNTDALNLTTSWTTSVVPGSGDIAEWNNTVTGANSSAIGGDMSWQGIKISTPGGAATIAATTGNTLTLGTSGIDMTTATQNLTVTAQLALGSDQAWTVQTGRTLTINGGATAVTNNGYTLTVNTTGTTVIDASANNRINGTGGLVKTGAGTLRIGAGGGGGGGTTHNFTGPLWVKEGVLESGKTNFSIGPVSEIKLGDTGTTGTLYNARGNTGFTYDGVVKNFTLVAGGTGEFRLAAGLAMTLDGVISGGGNLLKTQASGTGNLILSGTNTYTGTTTVSGDALTATKAAALPGYNSAGKVIVNGGTLVVRPLGTGWTTGEVDTLLANATKTSGGFGIDTANGNLTQWTAFTNTNLGPLTLVKLGANALTLDQANTHSGGTTLSAGTLNINHAQALGTGTFTITANSTINNTSGAAITNSNNNPMAWTGNFTFTGTNDLNLGTGAVTINAHRDVTVSAGTLTVGGVISGGFNLKKLGAGTMVLSGINTFNGEMNITGGVLVATNIANGGSPSSIGTNSGGANLCIYPGATFKYTGPTGSTNRVPALRDVTASSIHTIDASGTGALNFTGTANINYVGTGAGSAFTLNLTGTNADDNTLRPNLVDYGAKVLSLTKSGVGKWILTGTNTYTGTTAVNQGTLIVNGSIAGSASVAGGATLGGDGTVGGATVSGILAPGSSIGSLDVTANATFNGGTLLIDVDGTGPGSVDLLGVGGILDITTATVDFDLLAALDDPAYVFAQYGSLPGGAFQSVADLPAGYEINYHYLNQNQIALVQMQGDIPEPATMALLGLAACGLGGYIRRRRTA